ncbi:MAG: hypothetical protein JSW00_06350 [Thermoplasmata archaeon]|nr:MAG: hypothetical protein JSW00_06350 [Thermoplasmata archaeon]
MKHIQPKTFQIMVAILSTRKFSQRGLWRLCKSKHGISIGQINKVVTELQQKGFIERLWRTPASEAMVELGFIGEDTLDFDMGRANYILTDPVGLLRYISLFRSMNELRSFTLNVDASEEKVIAKLLRQDAVFCLGTAQEQYTPYYRSDEVSFYSRNPNRIYSFFRTAKRGQTKVNCYSIDYIRVRNEKLNLFQLLDSLFAHESEGMKITTKVQTVVDMFCDGKSTYTKPLLKSLWGVEI